MSLRNQYLQVTDFLLLCKDTNLTQLLEKVFINTNNITSGNPKNLSQAKNFLVRSFKNECKLNNKLFYNEFITLLKFLSGII